MRSPQKYLWDLYMYLSPVPALTRTEAAFFHAFMATLIIVSAFMSRAVVPFVLQSLWRMATYYATGQLFAVNVLVLMFMAKALAETLVQLVARVQKNGVLAHIRAQPVRWRNRAVYLK